MRNTNTRCAGLPCAVDAVTHCNSTDVISAAARTCSANTVKICQISCGASAHVWVPMQASGNGYGIILRRQDPAAMLLGSVLQFRFPDHRVDIPVAALQRTFLGKHVPIEAFQVNMTTLSPQKLCSHLQGLQPRFAPSLLHSACSLLVRTIAVRLGRQLNMARGNILALLQV